MAHNNNNNSLENSNDALDDNKIRILVLGENASGKSTLVNILINQDKEHILWDKTEGKSMQSF